MAWLMFYLGSFLACPLLCIRYEKPAALKPGGA